MPESPLSASPYQVLGVPATATDAELRRAYRRKLRETHPDSGGAAESFHAVQRAWELVGTPDARAAYDRGSTAPTERSWAPSAPPPRQDTRPQARTHGHPGGWFRERYLAELREWAGRGVDLPDPYDPQLLRSAPWSVRHLLAAAVAEEGTARALATLGIGYTVWHDIAVGDTSGPLRGATSEAPKLDHLVLGPTGLWALLSEDWGAPVHVRRGELVGDGLAPAERPVHELSVAARTIAKAAKVPVSALVVVVPDGEAEGVESIGRVRGIPALLAEQSRLAHLVRTGIPGVGVGGADLFEVRARLQRSVRFA